MFSRLWHSNLEIWLSVRLSCSFDCHVLSIVQSFRLSCPVDCPVLSIVLSSRLSCPFDCPVLSIVPFDCPVLSIVLSFRLSCPFDCPALSIVLSFRLSCPFHCPVLSIVLSSRLFSCRLSCLVDCPVLSNAISCRFVWMSCRLTAWQWHWAGRAQQFDSRTNLLLKKLFIDSCFVLPQDRPWPISIIATWPAYSDCRAVTSSPADACNSIQNTQVGLAMKGAVGRVGRDEDDARVHGAHLFRDWEETTHDVTGSIFWISNSTKWLSSTTYK